MTMKKSVVILIHVIFWIFYIFFPSLPLIFPEHDYPKSIYVYFFANTVLNIINFYIAYLAASPELKLKHKIAKTTAFFSLFVIGFTVVRIYSTIGVLMLAGISPTEIHLNLAAASQEFLNTLGFSFVPITLRYTLDWVRSQQLKSELLNRNQAGEIALLKSQLNPHFLFNTLNNIYALVLKKSDEAPAGILKLSGIMRYMLNVSNTEFVSLKEELEYLKSYVELQTLRFPGKDFVRFEVHGNIDNKYTAPLLFISLVENAFKYCSKNHSPAIQMMLYADEHIINFQVKNYFDADSSNIEDSFGIGLKNVKRRLELIYPETHKFDIMVNENEFIATIIMENKHGD